MLLWNVKTIQNEMEQQGGEYLELDFFLLKTKFEKIPRS